MTDGTKRSGLTASCKGRARRCGLAAVAGALALGIVLFGIAERAAAQSVTDVGSVIQTLHTSSWSPPSPDPVGITWRPDSEELLTCDAEVEETGLFVGVNLWAHSTSGVVSGTATTTAYSAEPTGIAFDPAGGRLWISDDNQAVIFEVDFGADGVWGSADDSVMDLDGLGAAGCDQLADVTYDNLDGRLYVASGTSSEICVIDPGPDGSFGGAASTGDDEVSTFSVAAYGILAPEGIVYDPFWNTLVIADRSTRDLYELTPEGGYLRKIDVNFPGGTKPSGVTIAPGSTNPLLRNYWVTDRRVDNNTNPFENDGRIYEVVALPLGGNGAPVVDAGPPQILEWPANSASLSGFVSDDGHPYPPSLVLSLWSKLSGPGSVTFESQDSPVTTASFSAPGDYVLQLVGDDSQAQSADSVAITLSQLVTLSVTAVGPGSIVLDPPGGVYNAGTLVTLTAAPDGPGSLFDFWSGDSAGSSNPLPLAMDGDLSVTAHFRATGGTPASCGIGPELAALMPVLGWLYGRRRRA